MTRGNVEMMCRVAAVGTGGVVVVVAGAGESRVVAVRTVGFIVVVAAAGKCVGYGATGCLVNCNGRDMDYDGG